MKTVLHLVAALALVGIVTPGSAPVLPADGTVAAPEVSPAASTDALGPRPIRRAEGFFNGSWCQISCSDTGPFTSVRSSSTRTCCGQCANFCGTGCIAHGQGTAVRCTGS